MPPIALMVPVRYAKSQPVQLSSLHNQHRHGETITVSTAYHNFKRELTVSWPEKAVEGTMGWTNCSRPRRSPVQQGSRDQGLLEQVLERISTGPWIHPS